MRKLIKIITYETHPLLLISWLFIFSLFSKKNAFGASGDSGEYISKQIQQQQKQEQDYRDNIRRILETKRVKDSEKLEASFDKIKETSAVSLKDAVGVYKFNKIVLMGNRTFSYKKLYKEILRDFIGKPINRENISLLQSMIMDYYVKRGYIGVKVYFDRRHIKWDSFAFIIEEGKVNKIEFKNSKDLSFRKKTRLFFAFPFLKGRSININDLEQGLDQMNKLESNKITMQMRPAGVENLQDSASDIEIINNKRKTTFFGINYNNGGTISTGENVVNVNLSQDNLFAMNDNIYINYSESENSVFNKDKKEANIDYGQTHYFPMLDLFGKDKGKKRYSKSLYASFSFPFGYWSFNSVLNYATYKTLVEGKYTFFNITGESVVQTYCVDRVICRKREYKMNLGGSIGIQESQSYIRDIRSETGSARRSNVSLYLNNTIYTRYATVIIKPSYQKGLSCFGAKKDADVYVDEGRFDVEPRLQYDIVKLYMYCNAQIIANMYYSLMMDSQYSFNSLYGNEQMSVGGQYSVRGFRNSTISGDSGLYVRNEVMRNVLKIFNLGIFYDFGYVRNKHKRAYDDMYDSQSGSLSGCGVCVRCEMGYINMSLTYAKCLNRARYLKERDGIKEEDKVIYWRLGAKI
jgi:hemolysin activation/secretion protein